MMMMVVAAVALAAVERQLGAYSGSLEKSHVEP